MVPQILLALCTRLGVYKSLEGAGGDEGPWSGTIYGKGCQYWIFLEADPSLLKRFWCSSSSCVWYFGFVEAEVRLWFGCS